MQLCGYKQELDGLSSSVIIFYVTYYSYNTYSTGTNISFVPCRRSSFQLRR